MAEYRILAKLDPAGVTAGVAKGKQELRSLDATATNSGATMARAFSQQAFDRGIAKLVGEIRALRGEVTGLAGANNQLISSNSRASSSIDQLATSNARVVASTGAGSAATARFAGTQAQLDAATRRVLTVVDQEALHLERLNLLMADANRLKAAGAISSEHYAAVQQHVTQALNAETAAGQRQLVSVGQRRAGYQQLGYQIQDTSMQLALGISPLTVFAQQAGQTASAVQLMTGKTTGFIGFMGGPWGAIMIASIAILGNLAAAYFGSGEAAQAAETGANALSRAQSVLGGMFDMTSGKIERQNALLIANARLTAIQLRGEAMRARQTANQTFQAGLRPRSGAFGSFMRWTRGRSDQDQAGPNLLRPHIERIRAARTPEERAAAIDRAMRETDLQPGADANTDVLGNLTNISGDRWRQALIDTALAEQNVNVADAIDRSLNQGSLDPSLRRDGGTGRKGGGGRADPVADFFQRLTQQRDAAGVPPSLDRRILETTQEAARAFNRPVSAAEQERIALLVREIDQREILQHLTEAYNAPMQREIALLGQTGLQREVNNAIMAEESQLHRTLTAEQRILIENSIRWRDSLQRQQAVIESIDGPVNEYRAQIAALNVLLAQGKISQEQFNVAVRDTPLAQRLSAVDQTLTGTMTGYLALLDQINTAIERAIETVNEAERAGAISPEEAARRRVELRGEQGTNGDIVTGGRTGLRDRQIADLNRQMRAPLAGVDQTLGGDYAYNAERDRLMEENRQRLEIIREARRLELIEENEANARILESRRQMNMQLTELDSMRYQVAFRAASESFGQVADVMKQFAGEHSRIYRAMFIVSKAFAIAESIVAIQVAIAKAMQLPFPANIPAIAQVIAIGASIMSNILAVSAQFDKGGYTGDGDPRSVAGLVHGREFVVNAPATARNRALLEAINSGRTVRAAQAAQGRATAAGGPMTGGVHIGQINVKVEGRSDDPERTGREVERGLLRAVRKIARDEMKDQRRDGGILSDPALSD